MVEYLESLVEHEKYREALVEAERVLETGDITARDLAIAHCVMAVSRYHLDQFHGAITAGHIGIELAAQNDEWDWYGRTVLDMGTAYYCLGQWDEACSAWFDYLAHLPQYQRALRYEANVWYNLANVYNQTDDTPQATEALLKAIRAAKARGQHRAEHGFRHALIEVHMKAGNHTAIPALLAKCLHYLRHNPGVHMHKDSWLWHLKLRSEYALKTNRVSRAKLVAVRGVMESESNSAHAHNFHMILARLALAKQDASLGLGHYLAARMSAAECGRADLEAVVLDAIHGLTAKNPHLVEALRGTH